MSACTWTPGKLWTLASEREDGDSYYRAEGTTDPVADALRWAAGRIDELESALTLVRDETNFAKTCVERIGSEVASALRRQP